MFQWYEDLIQKKRLNKLVNSIGNSLREAVDELYKKMMIIDTSKILENIKNFTYDSQYTGKVFASQYIYNL